MKVENIAHHTAKINGLFSHSLTDCLARESGFVKRSTGKINPHSFLTVMVAELSGRGEISQSGICDLLQLHSKVKVSPQAVCARLAEKHTVRFLARCFNHVLAQKVQSHSKQLEREGLLGKFSRIFIEDSTTCTLNQATAHSYKGFGGSGAASSYKIHAIYEVLEASLARLQITPGNSPDQAHAKDVFPMLAPGDLVLRDLGYFSAPVLKEIDSQGAHYISRYKNGVGVYTVKGERIENLPKFLESNMNLSGVASVEVLLGAKDKYRTRMVAYRVSDDVVNTRLRKQHRVAQKSGHSTRKATKAMARFTILITSIPIEKVATEQLGVLYGIRWQIELFFKTLKSRFHVHMIRGKSKARVECYIISRLLAMAVAAELYSGLSHTVAKKLNRELSFDKFVSWLLTNRYLLVLFRPEGLTYEVREMINMDILRLCKQQRKRATSLELLAREASIFDKYPSPSGETKERLNA